MTSGWKKVEALNELDPGDLVKHAGSGTQYQVYQNYGDHVTAVRCADITNPSEWYVWKEEKTTEAPNGR